MNNLVGLIVTKDRAVQLKLLLDSLEKNAPALCDNIYIIHVSSNQQHKQAYLDVFQSCKLAVTPIEETSYGSFPNALINITGLLSRNYSHLFGLTDDTIFYRPLFSPYNTSFLLQPFENPELLTLSMRLGRNTIYQNPDNHSDRIKIPAEYHNHFAEWKWTAGTGDHNEFYPISLDGHIYRTSDFDELCKSIKFKSLRDWEGELIAHVRGISKWSATKFKIACPELSFCVNVPYNMVNPPYYDTFGPFGVSIKTLLEKYQNNLVLDLDMMLKDVVIEGSHQYLPLFYKPC